MAESSNSAAASENTSTETPTASSSSTATPQKLCAACSKPEEDPETKPLKDCAKCHSVHYCGKECQKADFKAHKKVCAGLAQEYAIGHEPKMASRAPPKQGGSGRGLQKWQFDT